MGRGFVLFCFVLICDLQACGEVFEVLSAHFYFGF